MGRRKLAGVALALVVTAAATAGCGVGGDDDGASGGSSTTSPPSSTSSTTSSTSTTTSTTAATTTTAPASTTTSGGGASALGETPTFRGDAASGSGCTPGGGMLPDGWWYGTLAGPVGAELRFDLACYYVGAAAEEVAAGRGDEVNNDYYVVNENPTLRTVPVSPAATANCVVLGSGVGGVACAPAEVAGDWAVWLRTEGGTVTRIVEQFAP